VTKLVTATMLMHLRDAGIVHLDDPLTRYVPTFRMRSIYPDTTPITLRHLATHLAGLPKDFPYPYFDTLDFPSMERLLPDLPTAQVAFPPQTTMHYSNLGYALLGHALESAARQPYRVYVLDQLLRPLGMQQSGFGLRQGPDLATGYIPSPTDRPPLPVPYLEEGALEPAGGLYASVKDMARLLSLQFAVGPAHQSQILSGATIREMHAPTWIDPTWERGVGLGWWLRRVGQHTEISHAGEGAGFTAEVRLIPALKLGLVVSINTNTDTKSITQPALDVLLPAFSAEEGLWPSPATQAMVDASRYIGHYVGSLPSNALEVWLEEGRLMGQFTGDVPFVFVPEGAHQFRMRGGNLVGELASFNLDAQGQVSQLRFYGFTLRPRESSISALR
jgi:CubicO group peptidase (beta-lactamase class C family)